MNACFEAIPVQVRQQAFDLYVAASKRDGFHSPPSRIPLMPGDMGSGYFQYNCCPWGAVNYVFLKNDPHLKEIAKELGYNLRIPGDGFEERDFLGHVGMDVDAASIERFIRSNDSNHFMTFAELAEAMGVTYAPEQES